MKLDLYFYDESGNRLALWENYPVVPQIGTEVLLDSTVEWYYTVERVVYHGAGVVELYVK